MIVTINGVDGSGKSTIINSLAQKYQDNFTQYHSRPGIFLPKNNLEKLNKYVHHPDKIPKRGVFLQILKIILFIIEFNIVGIWYKITSRKKLIILERSLVDLCIHPSRYGLDNWITERFKYFLFDWYSNLNICLTGDAYIIANRKPELQISKILYLNNHYEAVLSLAPNLFFLINTTNETISLTKERMIKRIENLR